MAGVLDIYYGDNGASGFIVEGVISLQPEVVIQENHSRGAIVTEHPLEDGATAADHIINMPREITLTGRVSDYPVINDVQATGAVRDAVAAIHQLMDEREPVRVVTHLGRYENMAITRAEFPVDADGVIDFTLNLSQILRVRSETVTLPVITPQPTRDRAQSRTGGGRQQKQTPSEREDRQSRGLLGWMGGDWEL